ncbi:oxidoreductase [Ichthyenterobacterium sp. W332]|uniref:Oxidoreductase n=1 Tax=Microcosmobacter mediterraneus TaxID=3075607 RepID=A0ABU2YJS5_9FLAO|nr:oxidoreductase [Ichthyenterobacterium sp. W332]MDT0557308.1 oxidoreductase [Ichthyenterobacterium sp. W332]
MKVYSLIIMLSIILCSCKKDFSPRNFSKVEIETIAEDSTYSIRALEFDDQYIYYGSADHFGKQDLDGENKIDLSEFKFSKAKHHTKFEFKNQDGNFLHFRAIAVVEGTMFAISIANPAKLYKLHRKAKRATLVYEEINDTVFYDAMAFWNEKEGISIGDSVDGCLSIIITRDGGNSWTKLTCDQLPKGMEGEGAFAASDTNIATVGNKTWVATTAGRIYYSDDKGNSWTVIDTPIVKEKETEGIYSIDFYNEKIGYGIGGDYLKPADSSANKIKTIDGGKTWQLAANNQSPGYRSCLQYLPHGEGEELVAVGFKGVDYSNDGGETWTHLSDESFYTIRFINEEEAYAAGRGRICKLTFKE